MQPLIPTPSAAAMASANAATESIPDWITQAQLRAQATAPGVQGDTSWVAGHLPALPPVAFNPSRVALRVLAALWLTATVAVGLSVVTGVIPSAVAGAASFLFILIFIAITTALFRRTPGWRARHEKLITLKERRAKSSEADRAVVKLERARHDVDKREKRAIEKIARQADKAKGSEQKELADINTRLAAQVQKLDKQKQKLQSSESKEIGNALRLLQQQHVTAYLKAATIRSAKISGIGPGIMSSLAVNGITSAADFTGLHYQTGPRGGAASLPQIA